MGIPRPLLLADGGFFLLGLALQLHCHAREPHHRHSHEKSTTVMPEFFYRASCFFLGGVARISICRNYAAPPGVCGENVLVFTQTTRHPGGVFNGNKLTTKDNCRVDSGLHYFALSDKSLAKYIRRNDDCPSFPRANKCLHLCEGGNPPCSLWLLINRDSR